MGGKRQLTRKRIQTRPSKRGMQGKTQSISAGLEAYLRDLWDMRTYEEIGTVVAKMARDTEVTVSTLVGQLKSDMALAELARR